MAEDTTSVDQIAAYLGRLQDLAGKVLTIHVNLTGKGKGEVRASELEQARQWAREVDRDDNPYAAIVSVLMLREGWDVRNVSVIVPLRALTSKNAILPEQTLGRGLRRMTPPGSGVEETVVVIEHEAFRRLWDDALDDEGLSIERKAVDDVRRQSQVIAVEPERTGYDIAIPLLPRLLSRQASGLATLTPEQVPERRVQLADTLRSNAVDYVGRDILTGQEVDRATYALDRPHDPTAVLAWFVNELQRDTRLTGQFAVLAPLVKGYLERRLFGGPVDLADPLVLQALEEPANQETVLGVIRQAVDEATLQRDDVVATETKELLLSSTRPFLWSRDTAVVSKSVFNRQPCDSGLEVSFCAFLDRCPDVAAFAKLAREVRFSLEYRAEGGRLAYYYPDFVVRLNDGAHLLVETKGLADLDVPHKDERATRWAVDATIASGVRWRYLRVDEEPFRAHEASLSTAQALVDLVYARKRERLLADIDTGRPPARTPEQILASMETIRRKTVGVTGADEELRRTRDGLGD
jgi:type III restriction enzyme